MFVSQTRSGCGILLQTDLFEVLESQEKEEKRKYLGACLDVCRHCTPFMLSVDRLASSTQTEAWTFAKYIAFKLSGKWQKPYSQVYGYVKVRLSIAQQFVSPICTCAEAESQRKWQDFYTLTRFPFVGNADELVHHLKEIGNLRLNTWPTSR